MSLLLTLMIATLVPAPAAILYQVNVNTTGLPLGTLGNINFQFNPGGGSQPAFITISNFITDGTLLGVPSTVNGASGALPGLVTINNSGGLNDYFHAFTFGTYLQFILTVDGAAITSPNGTATSGSTFGLAFFAADEVTPLLTTDPSGFAGVTNVLLNGTVTTTAFPAAAGGPSAVTFSDIPEPSTLLPVITALLAIGFLLRRDART